MSEQVGSIHFKADTTDLERTAQALDKLAQSGPKVSNSLKGVEQSVGRTGKSLATIGGSSQGLDSVGKSASAAAAGLNSTASAAEKVQASVGKVGNSASGMQSIASGSKEAARGLDGVKNSADTTSVAMNTLRNAMALTGVGFGAKELLNLTDGYTKFTAQLKLATDSVSGYAEAMSSVKRIATDAQQGIGELGTLYARISNSTKEMGLSQQKVADISEVVAMSLKASGATANEASSAMLQLSQAFGSGVLRGEEFNAVNEAAPRLMKALAEGMGVPIGALREMASEGKITAEVMAKALPKALQEVRKEAQEMQTIGGAFTVLRNEVMEFVGVTAKTSGAVNAITSAVQILADNLNLVTAAAAGFGAVKLAGFMLDAGAKATAAATSTVSYVSALNQQRAASIAAAQAEASVTAARASGLAAVQARSAAEYQAAAAAAANATTATARTQALMAASVAELNLARATVQHTAASAAATTAQSALNATLTATSVAATAASRALALVGGPIGLITTALGLGVTAWMAWGRSAEDSSNKAHGAVVATHSSIMESLDKQIAKLKERAGLLNIGNVEAAKDAGPEAASLAALNSQIEAMRAKGASADAADQVVLIELQRQYENLNARLQERKKLQDDINTASTSKAAGERYLEILARQNGVTKQFVDDLNTYADLLKTGDMTATQYADAVTKANKARYESTEAGKAEAKALKESEKGARSGANAYAALSQKAADYVKALQLESQQGSKLTQSQKLQIELENLLATSKGKVNAAAVAGIQASLAIAKAMEGEAVATKRAQEAYQEYLSIQGELADYDVARSKALESARLAMDASETTARESLRRIELEAGLIGASNEKRTVMLAQLEEEIRLEKELAAINALDTTEENREELRKRARVVSAKNIAVAEGKAYVAEWDKTSQLIGDTLSDYIMGGGKDAATYLKRLFSTLVLQPVVQTLVSGVMGTGAAAASGAGSGIAGAVGSGQSIFSAFSGSLTAGVGGTIASLGASLGASAATAFGSGIAAGGSLGLTAGLSQGASMLGAGAGGTAAGLGTIAGAALPWVAGAAALYSIIKSFDNSGTLHYGAGATYSGGKLQEGAGIYNRAQFGMGAAGEWSAGAQQNVSSIAGALGAALDTYAVSFGQKAGYEISTAFADDSSKDGAWGSLRIADAVGNVLVDWENTRSSKWAPREFGDGENGYQEYLDAVAVDVKSAFLQMDIPGWGKQLVQAATDLESLSAALTQIGAIKTAFEAMGRSMQSFANLTGDMQTQLINASGGIEALSNNAAAYYESYYTEAERMQNLREQVNASLESLGVSLGNPLDAFDGEKAMEAFRRNLDEAMATEQGELSAAMLALNQDFAMAANYAEKLGDAVDGTAGSMRAAIDALSDAAQSALSARSTASSLLGQIGSATGNGYASQREGQLWSAMGSANGYQQQIDLASELTDLVLGRYEAEKQLLEQNSAIARQTGEQQIAFARQLGDYVQSLMTGSLSPLTNAEKLSQAQQNYQGTLAAAQGGDKVAQGNLQNVSSEYLQLARMYFASSDDYTKIFDAVTSQLGNLSAVTMSEGQMQISIAEQSLSVSSSTLGQLGTLQTVLERAYAEADADYTVQTDLLQEQLQAMLGVKGGVEAVTKAIASMPTELAVLFNSLNKVNGSHANGLSYVPFDGYRAELHKGERVLTAAENSAYRPDFSSYGRGGDAALVAEVKALRAEVAALRSENREDAAMQARATVQASQLNAQEVVQGVGGATERAAYQSNMGVTMR